MAKTTKKTEHQLKKENSFKKEISKVFDISLRFSKQSTLITEEDDGCDNDLSSDDEDDGDQDFIIQTASNSKDKVRAVGGRNNILSDNVTSVLDRTNLSVRQAAFVINNVAISLGHDVSKLASSRSTIHNRRRSNRCKIAAQIKGNFTTQNPVCVHWDGKLLRDLIDNNKTVDRLPVIISGIFGDKMLGVPKIQSGTGLNQALTVYQLLQEWNLLDVVSAFCFDTTAANTGLFHCLFACKTF